LSEKEIPFKPERKNIIGHDGIGPILLVIAIGGVGGFVFNWLKMPLAWMLGSCMFSTVAAFAGLRIGMRVQLRQGMIIILGVLLGSGFSAELVQRLGQWAISLGIVSIMTLCGASLCYLWLRRFTDWNRPTCYFAAMPGGLNDMTILGGAMGGQERAIALAHALRILTVVMTIPVWYRLVNGAQTSVLTMVHGPTGNDWKDYAILVACGLVGATVARLLRLPASFMMGPMILSAIAHLSGLTDSKPPGELVAAAQVVVGAGIGYGTSDFSVEVDGLADLNSYGKPSPRVMAGGEYLLLNHVPLRAGYRFDMLNGSGEKMSHAVSAGVGYVEPRFGIEASVRRTVVGPSATMIFIGFAYYLESLGLQIQQY